MVGRDAGLSGVEAFAPGDALGRRIERGVGGDDGRTFAPQFQADGGQMRRGRRRDDAAHAGAARVKNKVETLPQQGRGRIFGMAVDAVGAAFDQGHVGGVEHGFDQDAQRLRRGRSGGRGLEHGAVSGGHGRRQRQQGQLDRIVPGREDQGHAQGLGMNAAGGGPQSRHAPGATRLRPAADLARHVAHFIEHLAGFGQVGFARAFAQVPAQGVVKVRLVFPDGVVESQQFAGPKGRVQRGPGPEITALLRHQGGKGKRGVHVWLRVGRAGIFPVGTGIRPPVGKSGPIFVRQS